MDDNIFVIVYSTGNQSSKIWRDRVLISSGLDPGLFPSVKEKRRKKLRVEEVSVFFLIMLIIFLLALFNNFVEIFPFVIYTGREGVVISLLP